MSGREWVSTASVAPETEPIGEYSGSLAPAEDARGEDLLARLAGAGGRTQSAVLAFFDQADLRALAATSRAGRALASDEATWRSRYIDVFGEEPEAGGPCARRQFAARRHEPRAGDAVEVRWEGGFELVADGASSKYRGRSWWSATVAEVDTHASGATTFRVVFDFWRGWEEWVPRTRMRWPPASSARADPTLVSGLVAADSAHSEVADPEHLSAWEVGPRSPLARAESAFEARLVPGDAVELRCFTVHGPTAWLEARVNRIRRGAKGGDIAELTGCTIAGGPWVELARLRPARPAHPDEHLETMLRATTASTNAPTRTVTAGAAMPTEPRIVDDEDFNDDDSVGAVRTHLPPPKTVYPMHPPSIVHPSGPSGSSSSASAWSRPARKSPTEKDEDCAAAGGIEGLSLAGASVAMPIAVREPLVFTELQPGTEAPRSAWARSPPATGASTILFGPMESTTANLRSPGGDGRSLHASPPSRTRSDLAPAAAGSPPRVPRAIDAVPVPASPPRERARAAGGVRERINRAAEAVTREAERNYFPPSETTVREEHERHRAAFQELFNKPTAGGCCCIA